MGRSIISLLKMLGMACVIVLVGALLVLGWFFPPIALFFTGLSLGSRRPRR